MATKEEITRGLAKLEANYGLPPQLADENTTAIFMQLWEDRFAKVESKLFAEAIDVAINKRFRFPNIADMFQVLAEIGYRATVGARLLKPIAIYRDVDSGKTMACGAVKDVPHPEKITLPDGTVMIKIHEEVSGESEKKHGENHGGGSTAKSK